jgi:hypothetical protein
VLVLPDLPGREQENVTLPLMVPLGVKVFDEFRYGAL